MPASRAKIKISSSCSFLGGCDIFKLSIWLIVSVALRRPVYARRRSALSLGFVLRFPLGSLRRLQARVLLVFCFISWLHILFIRLDVLYNCTIQAAAIGLPPRHASTCAGYFYYFITGSLSTQYGSHANNNTEYQSQVPISSHHSQLHRISDSARHTFRVQPPAVCKIFVGECLARSANVCRKSWGDNPSIPIRRPSTRHVCKLRLCSSPVGQFATGLLAFVFHVKPATRNHQRRVSK